MEFYDRAEIGLISTRQRISLGNRDRDAAKAKAEEVAAALRRNEQPKSAKLTLKSLFDIYESEVTPTKGASAQHHDRSAFKLFFLVFKPMREVHTLSRRDWDHYIKVRRTGQLQIKGGNKRGVRNRMIAHDLQVLTAALNWATTARSHSGELFLERNPLKGCPLPVEDNPIRRAFSREQYRALVSAAAEINPLFRLAVVVAHYSGHRIGAIRHLEWSDINFATATIRWRSEHDKIGVEHVTPMSRELIAALKHAHRTRQVIGDAWLFPAPGDSTRFCSSYIMRDWMERGLKKIGIKSGMRYGWHSLRRQFATDLKHIPLSDLCALGGWKDPQTILKCYAQPDEQTMRDALNSRTRMAVNSRRSTESTPRIDTSRKQEVSKTPLRVVTQSGVTV
ncbi:MAG: site-specific integrase [Gemmatimonadaceae bacterium]